MRPGFPNGRRVVDDVTTVALRAVAGVTIPLVDPRLHTGRGGRRDQGRDDEHRRAVRQQFPYLGTPAGGFQTKPGIPAA